jgi:hypothetical protein
VQGPVGKECAGHLYVEKAVVGYPQVIFTTCTELSS